MLKNTAFDNNYEIEINGQLEFLIRPQGNLQGQLVIFSLVKKYNLFFYLQVSNSPILLPFIWIILTHAYIHEKLHWSQMHQHHGINLNQVEVNVGCWHIIPWPEPPTDKITLSHPFKVFYARQVRAPNVYCLVCGRRHFYEDALFWNCWISFSLFSTHI